MVFDSMVIAEENQNEGVLSVFFVGRSLARNVQFALANKL
jgi:hypothetical protein